LVLNNPNICREGWCDPSQALCRAGSLPWRGALTPSGQTSPKFPNINTFWRVCGKTLASSCMEIHAIVPKVSTPQGGDFYYSALSMHCWHWLITPEFQQQETDS
jgi:hypothetical protein